MSRPRAGDREFVIYVATNTVNGKRYVGATCAGLAHRRTEHIWNATAKRGYCHAFASAIRKYGADAFQWSVLSAWATHDEAMAEEVRVISDLKPEYNMTRGGRGIVGLARTPEWKAKISAAQKGRKISKEHIAKMHAARRAAKIGWRPVVCLNDGRWFENVKGAVAAYPGVTHGSIAHSASGREVSAKGLFFAYSDAPLTREECDRLIAERRARLNQRGENSRRKRVRPVVCITDGKAYPSGRAAAAAYGVAQMTIVQCCKDGARTASGLRFRYADEPARDKHAKTKAQQDDIRRRQNAGLAKSWAQTQKPVVCLETGVVYPSITHAAAAIGKHISLVSAAIHRNGRCGGLSFRFVE